MSKKTLYDTEVDRWKNKKLFVYVLFLFVVITGLAKLLTSIDEIKKSLGGSSEQATEKDTIAVAETSVVTKPDAPATPKDPLPKDSEKKVSITLLVPAEFEHAEIWINNVQKYPTAESTPIFKKLNIAYNVNEFTVVLKTAQRSCEHSFSISQNDLNNTITIPITCTH